MFPLMQSAQGGHGCIGQPDMSRMGGGENPWHYQDVVRERNVVVQEERFNSNCLAGTCPDDREDRDNMGLTVDNLRSASHGQCTGGKSP